MSCVINCMVIRIIPADAGSTYVPLPSYPYA